MMWSKYIWADCSSRYFCSAVPVVGGNYTQWHVQASLIEAFRIHTPDEVYTDMGKQENAKATNELIERLSSGRIVVGGYDDFLDRYPDAKIGRRHSTPSVPPVKPIESMIRRFTEALNQRGIQGYAKRDMKDPFRNKEIQDRLKKDARRGGLLTVEAGIEAIVNTISSLNTSEMKTEEGKVFVPSQFLWNGLSGRRVVWSDEDLAMLFYPRFIRKVRNASVHISIASKKIVFTAKELGWVRDEDEVMVLVNPFPPHEGSMIFTKKGEDWRYLCHAEVWIGYGVHPQDQETLQRAMEIKYGYLKQFTQAMREIHKHKPDEEVIRKIGIVTQVRREVKEVKGEVKMLPEVKRREDIRKKNWDALGKLAERLGY